MRGRRSSSFAPIREGVAGQRTRGFLMSGAVDPITQTVQKWHAEKANLGQNNLDAQTREHILYRLPDICSTLMRQIAPTRHRSLVSDVVRALRGGLVASPIDRAQIQRYIGDREDSKSLTKLSR